LRRAALGAARLRAGGPSGRPHAPPTETGEWNALGPIVNLNAATFEDLRGLGLSVPETVRLLAARERVQRFDSLEELEQIRFLPETALATLRRSCRV
jgi:DNA uptake protein ComE-like DNA-binding protein